MEYRALKTTEPVHSLELFKFDPKTRSIVLNEEAREKMEAALDKVADHVRTARGGAFRVRPAPSCKCPGFCHSLEICRVPGGPDTGGW